MVIFSLVRSKVLAATCGVGGYGLISQANTLVLTLQVIMGAGLGSDFVKLIAQNLETNSAKRLNQITSTLGSSQTKMVNNMENSHARNLSEIGKTHCG